jgi:peptidyl-prolyl cis-trans isomerase C
MKNVHFLMKASKPALLGTLTAILLFPPTANPVASQTPSSATRGTGPAAEDTAVVAEVGAKKIAAADLREALVAERKRALSEKRVDAFAADAGRKTLQGLIDVKLFALTAREQGLDRRPDIARRIEDLVDEALAQAELADTLSREPITDEALRRYYDDHPDEFQAAPRVRARHIVVRTREEATAIRQDLEKGADFATVAREHNIDSTKSTGGDLGWVRRGVMVKSFDQALFALKAGQTSAIVETPFGFHIVRAEEIEAGKAQAFSSAAGDVRKKLVDARIAQLKEALAHRYPVRVHEDVLAALAR